MSSRRQYPFHLIEPKWQRRWDEQQTFRAWNPGEEIPAAHPFAQRHGLSGPVSGDKLPPKCYILDMFPYPSGAGLHVGHPEGYTATDILARYRRARGFNVLHPMGWDAFGLPAEQYAIKTGQHPRATTEANIVNFKRQIQSLGFSYDWSREVDTTDPNYFRWTQWIFLQLYNSYFDLELNKARPISLLEDALSESPKCMAEWKDNAYLAGTRAGLFDGTGVEERETVRRFFLQRHRLAYVSEAPVNWCPELGTVLANEEVIDGKSEVGGYPVIRRPMRQWMLRITAYAERLLNDLDGIDWSHSLKEMQRNWIGKSEGAVVDFAIAMQGPSVTGFHEHLLEQVRRSEITEAQRPIADMLVANIDEHGYLRSKLEELSSSSTIPIESIAKVLKIVQTFHPVGVGARDLRECLLLQFERQNRETTLECRIVRDFMEQLGRRSLAEIAQATGEDMTDVQQAVARISLMEPRPGRAFASTNKIKVFTTRPDTLFGATYMVLSPEHKLVDQITTPAQRQAVKGYQEFAATKSDLERTELAKEKTGVFTGAYAINPVNNERIPIWIADYVLASYGTGAIMAVPGHDTRDLEFATKFNLPIVQVVQPPDPKTDWRGFVEDGTSVNSANSALSLNGLPTPDAKKKITAWLESKGLGKRTINYKLRDWLFSRQRYWGEPFPIVWRGGQHEALPESALPLSPPDLTDFKPTPNGDPPLARAKEWVALPNGATRETNTMPQWAGSCWYYLRYLDARNATTFCGKEAERYWMGSSPVAANVNSPQTSSSNGGALTSAATKPGVDLYVGGTEHAVLHLLYARFWHKVLFDLGHVSTPEPFFKLVNQGLILGELEFTVFSAQGGRLVSANHVKNVAEEAGAEGARLVGLHQTSGEKCIGQRVTEEDVEKSGDGYVLKSNKAIRVDARSFKMSKARGNVVNPDSIIAEYGADSLRLYEMFLGPLEMVKPWSTKGVEGVYRFLGRVWRLFVDEQNETDFEQAATLAPASSPELLDRIKLKPDIRDTEPTAAQLKTLHTCIKKVTEDLDGLRFNTAISELMVFVNEAMTWPEKPAVVLRDFLILLQPFAPHIAEELWSKLQPATRNPQSAISYAPWPEHNPALLVEDTLEIPVQVNGKLRDVIKVPATATPPEIEAAARGSEKVRQALEGKVIKKVIVVPKKIVNIAAG